MVQGWGANAAEHAASPLDHWPASLSPETFCVREQAHAQGGIPAPPRDPVAGRQRTAHAFSGLPCACCQVHALAHFPSLDRERERIVPAVDASGSRYQLRFRYWVNNQSRMYVLEGCQPPDVRASAWPPWQPVQAALRACSRAMCMPLMGRKLRPRSEALLPSPSGEQARPCQRRCGRPRPASVRARMRGAGLTRGARRRAQAARRHKAGDVIMFARGPAGELVVGSRRVRPGEVKEKGPPRKRYEKPKPPKRRPRDEAAAAGKPVRKRPRIDVPDPAPGQGGAAPPRAPRIAAAAGAGAGASAAASAAAKRPRGRPLGAKPAAAPAQGGGLARGPRLPRGAGGGAGAAGAAAEAPVPDGVFRAHPDGLTGDVAHGKVLPQARPQAPPPNQPSACFA